MIVEKVESFMTMVIVESATIPFHVPIAGLVGLELVGLLHSITINKPISELKRMVLLKTLMEKTSEKKRWLYLRTIIPHRTLTDRITWF